MLLGLIFSFCLPCSSRAVPASQGKLWDKICIAGRLVAELSWAGTCQPGVDLVGVLPHFPLVSLSTESCGPRLAFSNCSDCSYHLSVGSSCASGGQHSSLLSWHWPGPPHRPPGPTSASSPPRPASAVWRTPMWDCSVLLWFFWNVFFVRRVSSLTTWSPPPLTTCPRLTTPTTWATSRLPSPGWNLTGAGRSKLREREFSELTSAPLSSDTGPGGGRPGTSRPWWFPVRTTSWLTMFCMRETRATVLPPHTVHPPHLTRLPATTLTRKLKWFSIETQRLYCNLDIFLWLLMFWENHFTFTTSSLRHTSHPATAPATRPMEGESQYDY